MSLVRFGVSLDEEVLKELDEFVVENNLPNRSQGIRYLVNKNLVEKKWQCNNLVAGAVVILYDHQKGDVTSKLNGANLTYKYKNIPFSVNGEKYPKYQLERSTI